VNHATVLIVEDEAIVRKDLINMLEAMEYDPLCAVGTGDEAIEKAREYTPDIILMDINIPGTMNGIEAAGKIRDELSIPVIFVTSYADDMVIDRAKQVNPYGYVLKPFTERDLKIALEIALFRRSAEEQERSVEEPLITVRNGKNGDGESREYSTLSDIRTLLLGDFFHDIVLLIYNSAGVKELVLTSFIERSLKTRGNLLFAYSMSKAHRKFQREIQNGMIRTCRMKGGEIASLQQALSSLPDETGPDGPLPLRFIIDFSEQFDQRDILGAVDLLLAIRKKGVPVCGIIALYAGTGNDQLVSELSRDIPKVIVTTNRGTVISCADRSFPLEHLSFLPQPVVDEMVRKVLEPVILSFLERPVTGSDILHGIKERYNVSIPKARIYTRLYALQKMGYLATHTSRKTKLYYPTEAGKEYIHHKLEEFNSVFHHILVEVIDRDAGIVHGTKKG
jgi:two-component system, response regulator PdtaR